MFSSNFSRGKEISLTQIIPLYFYSSFVLLSFFLLVVLSQGLTTYPEYPVSYYTVYAGVKVSIVYLIQPSISLEESINEKLFMLG